MLRTYIVEDSPLIRDGLIATLEELAAVVVVGYAEDEASATAWLAQPDAPVDLLIIDLFLRRGSGMGVLRATQNLARRPRQVVLSNYVTADVRRACLRLGAHHVYDKSHEIDALLAYCAQLGAAHALARPKSPGAAGTSASCAT